MNYIAQVFGFIAFCFIFFSYQNTEKSKFLFTQLFSNLFFALQYLFLGAFSAMASSSLSILKTFIFYKYDKDKKDKKGIPLWILLIFEVIIIGFGVFTFEGLYSLIPIVISCTYTFGTWQKNLKITYIIGIGVSILWIYYNFVVGAYVSVFGSFIELFASVLGFMKVIRKEN